MKTPENEIKNLIADFLTATTDGISWVSLYRLTEKHWEALKKEAAELSD